MHTVIRTYSGKGAKELFAILEKNKAEVERLIRAIKGFVSYSLVRTASGGFSVSVYQDKTGTDESSRVARDWVAKNAGKTGVGPPTVSEGTVIVQLKWSPIACDKQQGGKYQGCLAAHEGRRGLTLVLLSLIFPIRAMPLWPGRHAATFS
jgi:hypothetical protein